MCPFPMSSERGEVTVLLDALRGGEQDAEARLLTLVYAELKRLASRYLRKERPDHTLQATDLVHEAYLRMVEAESRLQNRAHFFGVAAQAMRRVLIDHARAHRSQKRGDGRIKVSFDEALLLSAAESDELVELDEALEETEPHRSASGPDRRAPVFRRSLDRRDGRSARLCGSHGQPRVAYGAGLAETRARRRQARLNP